MGYFYECCPGSIAAPMTDFYAAAKIYFLPNLKVWGSSGRRMNYLEEEVKKKILKKIISAVFRVKIH